MPFLQRTFMKGLLILQAVNERFRNFELKPKGGPQASLALAKGGPQENFKNLKSASNASKL